MSLGKRLVCRDIVLNNNFPVTLRNSYLICGIETHCYSHSYSAHCLTMTLGVRVGSKCFKFTCISRIQSTLWISREREFPLTDTLVSGHFFLQTLYQFQFWFCLPVKSVNSRKKNINSLADADTFKVKIGFFSRQICIAWISLSLFTLVGRLRLLLSIIYRQRPYLFLLAGL